MDETTEPEKRSLLPIFFMGCFFIIIDGFALMMSKLFIKAGVPPAFTDPNNPTNIIYIVAILLIMTLLILLIAKFWKKQLIQILILGSIAFTAFYIILFLVSLLYLPDIITLILSIVIVVLLIIALIKYPEWYIIDLTGILIGTGAIAIFGMSLSVRLVIILLIILAIYDFISVYKTKHMIDLADTVMDLKLPVLLVIPKIRSYSLIKETKRLKEKLKEGEEREAFFMGLGDVVMPGILVVAAYVQIQSITPWLALPVALGVLLGTLVGFAALMMFVIKGKPQAGLPLLCSGAILGYLVCISILVTLGNLTLTL